MGNWTIKSSKLSKTFCLQNENLIIAGTFAIDEQTGELLVVSGSCYKPTETQEQGDLLGTFQGNKRDGKFVYTISDMPRREGMAVLDAIDEIEFHIKNND